MIKTKATLPLLVSVSLLAACYPMEQAPLVYSSKVQMGVHLSGGTTDTPGVELSIGYKDFDIAMVPVAVAKHCAAVDQSDCISTIYHMQTVLGDRSNSSNDEPIQTQLDDYKNQELAAIEKERELGEKYSNLSKQLADFKKWKQLDDEINATGITPEEQLTKTQLRDEIGDYSKFDIDAKTNESGILKTGLDAATSTISAAREGQKRLEVSLTGSHNLGRKDALSVFGSFDGDANAGTDTQNKNASGKLAVGKVFATGIAAQIYADAQKEAVINQCVFSMESSASKISATGDTANATKLRLAIPKVCSR